MYTIREVDANDKANFILSPNLFDVAKSKGWSLDVAALERSGAERSVGYGGCVALIGGFSVVRHWPMVEIVGVSGDVGDLKNGGCGELI